MNEGVTELLVLDALTASGLKAEDEPAYARERDLAAAIVKVTGRDRLLAAYFNGGAELDEFVAALGADTLARVKHATAANNIAGPWLPFSPSPGDDRAPDDGGARSSPVQR